MTRLPFARYESRGDGYCRWRSFEAGRERYVYVHRLLATLADDVDGLEDLEGREVHHVAGIPWLNVLEIEEGLEEIDGPLLEVREPVEHARHHLHDEPLEQPDEIERNRPTTEPEPVNL